MGVKINSTGGGSVTLDAPSTASNLTVTLPSTSGTLATTDGGNTTFTSITDSGNLTFTGTGNRILGDYSNATVPSRVMFQTSTTNGISTIIAIPNGTGTQAGFQAFNNSSASAASGMHMFVAATEATLRANVSDVGGTLLPMTFYTNNSERIRIDTSGNVGIGTSSPGARLTVQQATNDDTVGASFRGYTTATGDGQRTFKTQYADSAANYYANNQIRAASHQFYINNTEAMRLDSSGNLLLNTTTSNNVGTGAYGDAAQILKPGSGSPAFCAANSWAGGVLYVGKSVGGSGQQFIEFFQQGNSRGAITNTGTGVTYNSSSDYRLKENIQPMQNALATVEQLNPVTYIWKETGTAGQGFIAHELQEVVPDAVTGEKDAVDDDGNPRYQGIDMSRLVAILTKSIQELKAELDELKAKVN